MQYRWLLALFLAQALTGLAAASQETPRLVRYHFTDVSQVRPLFEMGADVVARGKGWIDVVMPPSSQMGTLSMRKLQKAVRGLRAEVRMEDAEEQFRKVAARPDLGVYHNLAEVKAELDAAAAGYPQIASTKVIGKTLEGRDIWAIRISGTKEDGKKPAFLYTGAHHAREWISVEVPLAIVKALTQGYATDPKIKALVDEREVWVVPVVNPDGTQHSHTQYTMWRKNRRNNGNGSFGVDPNRNYGYKWGGPGASPDPDNDTYRGPSAFSESETQAIRDLSRQKKFVSAISFHSYSELILWPWGYTEEPTRDVAAFERFGRAMAQFNNYKPQQSIELYPTTGDFDDFMYGELGTLAYTIELGTQFVPEESQVPEIVSQNLKAALWLLEHASDPFPPLMHDPLAATTDVTGPYKVTASLRDAATAVESLELVYRRAGGSADERVAMASVQGGSYTSQIPGGALGEVSYHFEMKAAGKSTRLPAQGEFTFKVVDSLILVVADDAGAGHARFYTAACEAAGKASSVWETKSRGTPPVAVMRGASAVVWFTGEASSSTITGPDQEALKAYLNAGGRLLLFGQDIGYDIKQTEFYRETMKSKFISDSSSETTLTGVAGTFAAGLSLTLGGSDAVQQRYPEVIEALSGASKLLEYPGNKLAALTATAGKGKLAYFGIGLEGIAGADARANLFAKALAWLSSEREAERMVNFERMGK